MRGCWVNFQCRGVLLNCIIVGQGPIALAIGAGGGCLDIFSLIYNFSFLSPSLWETAQYGLKYCLKGPLNPEQPTNQPSNRFVLGNPKTYLVLQMSKYCRTLELLLDSEVLPFFMVPWFHAHGK